MKSAVADLKSEGYTIRPVNITSKSAADALQSKGISSLPAMVYNAPNGDSDPRRYQGWKSRAEIRKMFDHTRDLGH